MKILHGYILIALWNIQEWLLQHLIAEQERQVVEKIRGLNRAVWKMLKSLWEVFMKYFVKPTVSCYCHLLNPRVLKVESSFWEKTEKKNRQGIRGWLEKRILLKQPRVLVGPGIF